MAGAAPAGSLTFSAIPQLLKNVLMPDDQHTLYSLIVALGFTIEPNSNEHLIHTIYKLLQAGNDEKRVSSIVGMDLSKPLVYLCEQKIDRTITPAMRAFVLMRIAQYLGFQHARYKDAIHYCDNADKLYAQTHTSKASLDHSMLRVSNLSTAAFLCHEQGYVRSALLRIQRAQEIVCKTQAIKSTSVWVLEKIERMERVSAVCKFDKCIFETEEKSKQHLNQADDLLSQITRSKRTQTSA